MSTWRWGFGAGWIGAATYVLAAIAFHVARSDAGAWTIDDAGITYAAAFQLVDHHSLATSLEGPPIEGYSNPLLFFVVAFLRVFGLFDPVTTHLVLETLVFAAMVTLVWSMIRPLAGEIAAVAGATVFAIVELATPATWTWYGSGLENVWVSAGLVAMLWLCLRTARGVALSHRWGTLLFAVAITRPEAPVYVAACYVALATVARPEGDYRAHLKQVVRAAVVTLALYVVFLAWRRIAYGEWLPNTYYAKMHDRHAGVNLRDYVVRGILPYARAGMFAVSALVLLVLPRLERVAATVVVFLVASLALPIAAGADWMGEHRFATSFLAVAHVAYALVVALCLARLVAVPPRAWRSAHVLALAGVLSIAFMLIKYDRNTLRTSIVMNDVTIGRIAHLEGGLRWEQQMRLGLPFPVVQMPDAGGSMMVGGAQMLDNGYLTDFQMARIGRRYGEPLDLGVLNQYQHEERHPDLVSIDDQFALDRSNLGSRYLMPPGGMEALKTLSSTVLAVRRDLVALDAVEGTPLRDGFYISPETVPIAGPRGLVRIELIVAWTTPPTGTLSATIEGDHDELVLRPYQATPSGIERVALLVGVPERAGRYPVQLALDGSPLGSVEIEVTPRPEIESIVGDADPWRAARRFAWLRAQAIPRLGMAAFHELLNALDKADRARAPEVGAHILKLRWNARLAETSSTQIANRLFTACTDVLCLGRTVDRLRRLGYLGTAALVGDRLDHATARDYRTLVGLVLARPDDLDLQRALLAARLAAGKRGSYPSL